MIIMILGGIGSGKSVSAVREIIRNPNKAYTNFRLKNVKGYHRIKFDDIIKKSKKVKDWAVNWEYWETEKQKNPNFSLYLDEIHNIINSRRSMSKTNVLLSKWVSQIRKILSDKPNNHLYLISQTSRKIDVDFRDLTQIVIHCRKVEQGKKILIRQDWYDGYNAYECGIKTFSYGFDPSPYFKYYDSHEMVRFSDAEEFI